jgi:hypothetical protein
MTGEQIQANIYMGPTYYMRLKHMVKDKINFRARGPNQQLTRQPVQGRANDGGLRIGEMERDAVCAHGLAYFLNESFLVRGDEYYMAVCNKTGAISIYNEERNLFLSPYADGPINFHTNPDGSMSIKNLTKYGRSFSLLRIPYSLKLLIQELQVMNIQMRIITDENVDQLLSMSYSNNISRLLNKSTIESRQQESKEEIERMIKNFVMDMNYRTRPAEKPELKESPVMPIPLKEVDIKGNIQEQLPFEPQTPPFEPQTPPMPSDIPQEVIIDLSEPVSPEYAPSFSSEEFKPVIPENIPSSQEEISILEVPKEININSLDETKQPDLTLVEGSEESKKVIEFQPDTSSDITTSSGIKKITI